MDTVGWVFTFSQKPYTETNHPYPSDDDMKAKRLGQEDGEALCLRIPLL